MHIVYPKGGFFWNDGRPMNSGAIAQAKVRAMAEAGRDLRG